MPLIHPIGVSERAKVLALNNAHAIETSLLDEVRLARMLDEEVLPRLAARLRPAQRGVMRATLLRTFGMGESTLEDELKDLAREEGVSLGFRTAFPDNYLRPVVRAATEAEAEARLARVVEAIEARLGPLVYGRDDETLEQALGKLLVGRGLSLAVAESCTGGLLAERITGVPGSSRYFRGGVVAYANEAIRREVLEEDLSLRSYEIHQFGSLPGLRSGKEHERRETLAAR